MNDYKSHYLYYHNYQKTDTQREREKSINKKNLDLNFRSIAYNAAEHKYAATRSAEQEVHEMRDNVWRYFLFDVQVSRVQAE